MKSKSLSRSLVDLGVTGRAKGRVFLNEKTEPKYREAKEQQENGDDIAGPGGFLDCQ